MGLEAYLFRLHFDMKVDFSGLKEFLLDCVFKIVRKEDDPMCEYRTCYELASKEGITKAQLFPKQKEVNVMSVRLSVMSPANVKAQRNL
ncbi:MAG: hypothetical protein JSV85_00465 [Candidatus Bathyarchaeota archaeon]|nr:MAG: hypothetical protein JSV85_00465 [Candidatus Bathyarchaeota archaeon]